MIRQMKSILLRFDLQTYIAQMLARTLLNQLSGLIIIKVKILSLGAQKGNY